MARIPRPVREVFEGWQDEFSPTVWERFFAMMLAAILLRGRRTVLRAQPLVERLVPGHLSSWHRVFSHRRWSMWRLGRVLARVIVANLAAEGTLQLVGDETVSQHRGAKVYGKACHRDAVRSAHGHLVHRWGHKWVVLALRVRVPGATRTWALPVLVALYRAPELSAREGRRHKTPADLMRGLLAMWIRWFPERNAIFAGDGAYGTHKLASFARRYRQRLTLVSKFYGDAVLHEPPPRRRAGQVGRKPVRGRRLPTPDEVAATRARRTILDVSWYGGGRRTIQVVSRIGHWYRQGHGLVPVRWVHVRDLTGSHRDECLMTTDTSSSPREIVESFVGRWDIEVAFEEMREHLGLEKTRGRCAATVLRVEPCLFALYALIALWFSSRSSPRHAAIVVAWPGKTSATFSDAIAFVRKQTWSYYIDQHASLRPVVEQLPRHYKDTLINLLAAAA